ncbi:MAG: hypothetical protein E7378_04725 [Clostridiales bacterium]|nr:hypothetical protein [Clostridiales bacterium]
MLDDRSKYVLNFLVKECNEGSYRVFDIGEILECLPKKYHADESLVKQCMQYLQKGDYIDIKYKDNKNYCVSPLPFARQILESESNFKQKTKKFFKIGTMLYILVFIFAFLGSFLAIIVYGLIF